MFFLRLRHLKFTDRLALCLLALPLLVLYLNWVRADGDCPADKVKNVPCPGVTASAPCSQYGESNCFGKTFIDLYVGDFECTGTTKLTMCSPQVTLDGKKALTSPCSAEYECLFDGTQMKCVQGDLVANVSAKPLYKTVDCVKEEPPIGGD